MQPSHVLASSLSVIVLGTLTTTEKLPLAGSGEARNTGLRLSKAAAAVPRALPSPLSSETRATIGTPSAVSASLAVDHVLAAWARAAASAFPAATTRSLREWSCARSRAARATGSTADWISPEMAAISRSSSLGASAAACVVRASSSVAIALAWEERSPVRPTIRRTPLEMPSSEMRVKDLASPRLSTWVPPQNSTLRAFHASLVGSLSRSSTAAPIDTTRTGSGYVSPNTARSVWMRRASARPQSCL
mmetsp:Transcript_31489/g.68025  ORF Transcript_31489/g.68025 Transcript_31489/m.68025 type:complete len:248 (+) Transcript_31489:171-914(+)